MTPLAGRVAVVTGGGRGIGRAVALELARAGAAVAPIARSAAELAEVAAEIVRIGGRAPAHPIVADVRDAGAVRAAVSGVESELGAVDILVVAAGIARFAAVEELSDASWHDQIDTNLTGAFYSIRAVLPGMKARRHGDLITIGSVASIREFAGCAAYGAAKFGLLGLTRVVREEARRDNVRVTAILPGATETAIWGAQLPAAPERLMPPSAVARAVLHALTADPRVQVEEILLRPQLGDL